jgi:hypothetical protein
VLWNDQRWSGGGILLLEPATSFCHSPGHGLPRFPSLMSGKAAKNSGELKRRQAFKRLQQNLQYATLSAHTSQASPSLTQQSPATVDAEEPLISDPPDPTWPPTDMTDATEVPPTSTSMAPPPQPAQPRPAPANHGVAFSLREPMTCEICQKKVTKWLFVLVGCELHPEEALSNPNGAVRVMTMNNGSKKGMARYPILIMAFILLVACP